MENNKQRLDVLLVDKGLAPSREKAKALVMSGAVYIREEKALKASQMVPEKDWEELQVRGKVHPFVSRGGLKLQKALEVFPIKAAGKTAIDVGASTGGFTDCLLQKGARKVYAVDVGYGQLDWRLRQDERVVVMERCNARAMEKDWFQDALELAVMDVSFISIKLILPALVKCLEPGAQLVTLIKPQFEAGRDKVGKKGGVRDAKVHLEVVEEAVAFAAACGFSPRGLSFSPITGPEGNIEFLLYACAADIPPAPLDCCGVVAQAHEAHRV